MLFNMLLDVLFPIRHLEIGECRLYSVQCDVLPGKPWHSWSGFDCLDGVCPTQLQCYHIVIREAIAQVKLFNDLRHGAKVSAVYGDTYIV